MMIKQLLKCSLLAAFAAVSFHAAANHIDANAAQATAQSFMKQKFAQQGKMMAPASTSIKLAHAEASKMGGNAYYVFNFDGGGWVIVAGDDLAKRVLAYGDKGNIDMNELPGNMKSYLDLYKNQIEEMQSYEGELVPIKSSTRSTVVEPLIKSTWGQSEPMNRRTPIVSGSHASVGCGPLAVAQIMYYWKYPTECDGVGAYFVYGGVGSMPALPATTFKYNQMLDAYTIYNPETNTATPGTFTDEQADAVAELCIYCGQACQTRYGSSSGSGSYTYDQRDAFHLFGYENAELIGIDPSYYCSNYGNGKYTTEQWIALICNELEAGRPIPYSNVDPWDGHAWVLDGVDADGKFHMNWGWYEKFNGWFEFGAFTVQPNGETWNFNGGGNEMIINCIPYEGYVIPGGDPEPTETCAAPNLAIESTGAEQMTVTIVNNEEGATVHYAVYNLDNNELLTEGQFTDDVYILVVEGAGSYLVACYASMENMLDSNTSDMAFTIIEAPQPTVKRGDVNGNGTVNMDDLTALINYLVFESPINFANAAICNSESDNIVNMDDLTALINYLVYNQW